MAGRFYEDRTVGDTTRDAGAEAAAASELGRILVNGTFTFAPMTG